MSEVAGPAGATGPTLEPTPIASEGTLTQLVRARRSGRLALDVVRRRIQRSSRLGTSYLGPRAVILGSIFLVRGLVSFLWTWPGNDWRLLTAVGWALVLAGFVIAMVISFRNRGLMPLPVFLCLLIVDAVALALDYAAFFGNNSLDSYLTVGIGVGATLLASVTMRPLPDLVAAVAALAAASVGGFLWLAWAVPGSADSGISQLVLTLTPVLAGVLMVRAFDLLVVRMLDRTVVESTIDAPGFGRGMFASSELARLDLSAEEFLDDVGTGRAPLPLERSDAALAARLGVDLRAVLVSDRHETWLRLAITESDYLAPVVRLTDPHGAAGDLEPGQRNGLLSAIWLIVDGAATSRSPVDLAVHRVAPGPAGTVNRAPSGVRILLSIEGIRVRDLEPAVWPGLDRVGAYTVDSSDGLIRVTIDVPVGPPDPKS